MSLLRAAVAPPRATLFRSYLSCTLGVSALLGWALSVPGLYGLAAAWAAYLLLGALLSRWRAGSLHATHDLYPGAHEGETVAIGVVLENRSWHSASLVEITDTFPPALASRQRLLGVGPLPPRRRWRGSYEVLCNRAWGMYQVGPLRVTVADPMGLFHTTRLAGPAVSYPVFPGVVPLPGLPRAATRDTFAVQDHTAGRAGGGQLFLGVRDYRSGDDLRRIHWPATARRGFPVVKEMEVDLMGDLTVLVDLHREGRAGVGSRSTRDFVIRAAASLLQAASRRGDRIQLFGEGQRLFHVPPGRGELHLTWALYELIQMRQDGSLPLLDLVEAHEASLTPGSLAALVAATVDLDPRRVEEMIQRLQARGIRPVLVLVNNHSFVQIDRYADPAREVQERCARLESLRQAWGLPGVILHARPRGPGRKGLAALPGLEHGAEEMRDQLAEAFS